MYEFIGVRVDSKRGCGNLISHAYDADNSIQVLLYNVFGHKDIFGGAYDPDYITFLLCG